jgi:hypothetical protein
MSFLRSLDATSIASRQSAALVDPGAWSMPIPVAARPAAPASTDPFSWWGLGRNPKAALMTAMVGTMLAGDALVRVRDAVTAR